MGKLRLVKPTLAICNSYSDNRHTDGQALIRATHRSHPSSSSRALSITPAKNSLHRLIGNWSRFICRTRKTGQGA